MPLLGAKAYILKIENSVDQPSDDNATNKIGDKMEGDEAPACKRPKYYLPLTNETFDSAEDLEQRTEFYSRKIWSCRCTGHPNMTYEEAMQNEFRILNSITKSFPTAYEAAVLHFVHLSRSPLPPLIDATSKMLSESLFIGEPVQLKIDGNSHIRRGNICHADGSLSVKMDPNFNSFHEYKPKRLDLRVKNETKKYCVKLESDQKVVKNVSQTHLTRLVHLPSKENLRLFIRSNTIRYGVRPESPWIVDEDARKRVFIPDVVYPLDIHMAIKSHTVYSQNMRLSISKIKPAKSQTEMDERTSSAKQATLVFTENGLEVEKPLDSGADEKLTVRRKQGKNAGSEKVSTDLDEHPKLEPFLLRTLKDLQEIDNESTRGRHLISKLARHLNQEQLVIVPKNIAEQIKARWDRLDERRKMAQMNPEEKKSYISEKIRQKLMSLRIENELYEDTQLTRSFAIPKPDKIPVPDCIHPASIGDILFICEFFLCFDKVLKSPSWLDVSFDNVFTHLSSSNANKHQFLNSLLIQLVKTLLKDAMYAHEDVYNIRISRIPLSCHTSLQLARQCLLIASSNCGIEYRDPEFAELANLLEDIDLMLMDTYNQIRLLKILCHLIMNSEVVSDTEQQIQHFIHHARKRIQQLLAADENPGHKTVDKPLPTSNNGDVTAGLDSNGAASSSLSNKENFTENLSSLVDPAVDGVSVTSSTKSDNKCLSKNNESIESNEKSEENKTALTDNKTAARATSNLKRQETIQQEKINKIADQQRMQKERRREMIQTNKRQIHCKLGSLSRMTRLQPLGEDAYYNYYWFLYCFKGILVEKHDGDPYCLNRTWHCYKTKEELDSLMNALMPKGKRESVLLSALGSIRKDIVEHLSNEGENRISQQPTVDQKHSNCKADDASDDESRNNDCSMEKDADSLANTCIGTICKEYISTLLKQLLTNRLLLTDIDELHNQLELSQEPTQIAQCVLKMYNCSIKRTGSGMLKAQKHRISTEAVPVEQDDANNPDAKDVTQWEVEWIDCVNKCKSYTRLYFLVEILRISLLGNFIGKRCMICCRSLLGFPATVCDRCNVSTHLCCLRPMLSEVPADEWLCRKCSHYKPVSKPDSTKSKNQKLLNQLSSVKSIAPLLRPRRDKQMRTEACCMICLQKETKLEIMAKCRLCQEYVHLECPSPPIRQSKRMDWTCWKCRRVPSINAIGGSVNNDVNDISDSGESSGNESDESDVSICRQETKRRKRRMNVILEEDEKEEEEETGVSLDNQENADQSNLRSNLSLSENSDNEEIFSALSATETGAEEGPLSTDDGSDGEASLNEAIRDESMCFKSSD